MRKLMLVALATLCAAFVGPGAAMAAAPSEEVLVAPDTETTVEVLTETHASGKERKAGEPKQAKSTLTLRNSERRASAEESSEASTELAALEARPGNHKLPKAPKHPSGEAAHAAAFHFGRVVKVKHLGGAHAATYIGNHQWWGVGIQQCSSAGCWFWNETEYTYRTWYNGNVAWVGGGAWMDPWHCNGKGFACTVNWYGWVGWNPAPYGHGQYLGAHTAFQTHFSFPWGGVDGSHWLEEHFYGDGYVGYHVGG